MNNIAEIQKRIMDLKYARLLAKDDIRAMEQEYQLKRDLPFDDTFDLRLSMLKLKNQTNREHYEIINLEEMLREIKVEEYQEELNHLISDSVDNVCQYANHIENYEDTIEKDESTNDIDQDQPTYKWWMTGRFIPDTDTAFYAGIIVGIMILPLIFGTMMIIGFTLEIVKGEETIDAYNSDEPFTFLRDVHENKSEDPWSILTNGGKINKDKADILIPSPNMQDDDDTNNITKD